MSQWPHVGILVGPLFSLLYLIANRRQPRQDTAMQAGGPAYLWLDNFIWVIGITGVVISLAAAVYAARERAKAVSATKDELTRVWARLA